MVAAVYVPLWVLPAVVEVFLLLYFVLDDRKARRKRRVRRGR